MAIRLRTVVHALRLRRPRDRDSRRGCTGRHGEVLLQRQERRRARRQRGRPGETPITILPAAATAEADTNGQVRVPFTAQGGTPPYRWGLEYSLVSIPINMDSATGLFAATMTNGHNSNRV